MLSFGFDSVLLEQYFTTWGGVGKSLKYHSLEVLRVGNGSASYRIILYQFVYDRRHLSFHIN